MSDLKERAIELHRLHAGKLAVRSLVPLAEREDLSLAYTPGVAAVCEAIAADPALARELTLKRRTVAVVTDGTAILGLGDLGPEAALPVMEGKAVLFKEFADVDAFPICLATKDTEEIIRTVKLIAPGFGGINLEDISAPRCFEVERRLMEELDIPVMHDDQRGTATVVLAGLINALKLRGSEVAKTRVVVNGAGAAGTAIAKLLLGYGFTDIIACDSHGIVENSRPDLNDEKRTLSVITNPRGVVGGLADAMKGADVFVGVSKAGALPAELIGTMNARPIIFALANPTPEIMPGEAKAAGAFIVATGRSDFANQLNNVLAFPGIFRGALDHGVRNIEDAMLVKAAEAIAACVAEPSVECIIPSPFDRGVAKAVAAVIKP
jgi:malate dehydrogenase (oxaloacetate-decarboxylating)